MINVAYQGEPGAWSEQAALEFFGAEAVPQPQATFGAAQALQSVTMKADLAAVWQSPQQGYVIDLRGRNPRAFHSTADACWLDAQLQKALPS